MKKIESTGFSDPAKASEYFRDKEILLEEMAKTLETITSNQSSQIASLEGNIKALRDELKVQVKYPKEFNRKDFLYSLGRGIAAVWEGNHKTLAELGFAVNNKSENWTNAYNSANGSGGKAVEKDILGEPMGTGSNDSFLINPIYENELLTDAAKKSVMMPLVRHRHMAGPSIFIPVRERGGIKLHWITAYGQKIQGSKPNGAERAELKAHILAGWVSWVDDFDQDSFADLGQMFVDEFVEAYGQEYDRQCLLADSDPFTGAMACPDASVVRIAGSTIDDLSWKDFRDAVYKVPAEERKDCCWFVHETVLNHIANIEDSTGRPIWRRPTEAMPGRLDLYPYHEVSILPQFADIGADEAFAVFCNPKRIQHGNRRGIELKKFDQTTESLEYGELFLRFRKRDGFLVTMPKNNIVVLKTKA